MPFWIPDFAAPLTEKYSDIAVHNLIENGKYFRIDVN
jgi:hypothetical protein